MDTPTPPDTAAASTEVSAVEVLPDLPRPNVNFADHSYPAFSAKQMQDYARAALAAALSTDPAAEVEALRAERDALRAKLGETWNDGTTVWTRPTAWAYAQACKVINGRQLSAEQRAEAAEARMRVLSEMVTELSDDLQAEIDARYPADMRRDHPSMQRPYDRDMDMVNRARAALSPSQHDKGIGDAGRAALASHGKGSGQEEGT